MKNKGLSRRAFLGSALAGSTIAALGLAGCAPSTASQAAAEKHLHPTWHQLLQTPAFSMLPNRLPMPISRQPKMQMW